MCPIDVMEPQYKIIWRACRVRLVSVAISLSAQSMLLTFKVLIHLVDLRRILSREASSIPTRAIHTHTCVICSCPLAPAIIILRGWVRSVMSIQNIRQCLDTQVSAVVLVRRPRLHGDLGQNLHDVRIKPERQFDPTLQDILRILPRVPSQCAVGIEVRQRWITAQPCSIRSDVHNRCRSS